MECLNAKVIFHSHLGYHKVPCGGCGFCLEKKRSEWMFRIGREMKAQSYPGWFITLTYEEKFVKRASDGRLSLRFRDIQLFLKKLRKANYYAKYVCVGEYGTVTARPHYHMLLWTNCPVTLLEGYWTSHKGQTLGRIHVGRITMESAMYTLKYILQPKQQVEGIEKVRAQFSKGLGLAYLSSAVYDYHTFDYNVPIFTSVVDGIRVALPRYYRNKIFTKYQCRVESGRLGDLRMKNETKKFRELRAQGVRKIRPYLKALRVIQSERIIRKSKVGLTL